MAPIIEHPSPNFGPRPPNVRPSILVIHYTGMITGAAALARLCDPGPQVSAHYLIEEDGQIYRLVAEENRAWHAGKSHWQGIDDVNSHSIGIELVNPGHELGYQRFKERQMRALEWLAGDIKKRWLIKDKNIVGHSDIAPLRKTDPGELFDWARLARMGLGVWPAPGFLTATSGGAMAADARRADVEDLQRALKTIGYGLPITGEMDEWTVACVVAFQRHWRQDQVDGLVDTETAGLIGWRALMA